MLFVQKHLSALYRSRILPLPVVIEYATSHRRVFVETRNNRRDRRSLNAIISGLEGDIHGARDQHSTAHLSKVRLSLASGNHKGTVQDTCSARRRSSGTEAAEFITEAAEFATPAIFGPFSSRAVYPATPHPHFSE